jgi:uncharacterized alkaline shock family protein YloU
LSSDTYPSTHVPDDRHTGEQSSSADLVADESGPLVSEHGATSIADIVVEKIAGVAAREVPGVHKLGGGAARMIGNLKDRLPGQKASLSQGVTVEVGKKQAAVDLVVVAEYGVSIVEVADTVRANVSSAIQDMTGLEVTEVNIAVDDIHLPDEDDDDDDDDDGESRVQ